MGLASFSPVATAFGHHIGWRHFTLQGIAYMAEWIVVGVVICLVYRGRGRGGGGGQAHS